MKFKTLEEVKKELPSAFAKNHDGSRSDRYSFVSTEEIIEAMDSHGFGISRIRKPKARSLVNKEYGIHEIYFADKSVKPILDPRTLAMSGKPAELYPELKILNSHNGHSKLIISVALYALICSNGLTISKGTVGEFSAPHMSFNYDEASKVIGKFILVLPTIQEKVEKYSTITLDKVGQREYAMAGAKLRWGDGFDGKIDSLLNSRRNEDKGMDLWTVFNKVQENLIKGGTKVGQRKNRPLEQLRLSNMVNEGLWDLNEQFAKKAA